MKNSIEQKNRSFYILINLSWFRLLLSAEKQRHYQWMFSHPWSAENTNLLEDLSIKSDVYTLAVSPVMVKLFEQYWINRKNPSLDVTPENYWTLEFLANMKKCHLETIPTDPKWLPCHNFNVAETPLASVLSHSRIIPAVHALNTFAYAFRTARNIKCNNEKGELTYKVIHFYFSQSKQTRQNSIGIDGFTRHRIQKFCFIFNMKFLKSNKLLDQLIIIHNYT